MRLRPLGEFAAITDPLTEYYLHPQSLSANPERMLEALEQILDRTLLADLRDPQRWLWRQRIRATQLASAGLIARDKKQRGELRYMLRSFCAWPSPFWEPKRLAMLAVSVRNRLRRHEETG